jgi:hypothetical protein
MFSDICFQLHLHSDSIWKSFERTLRGTYAVRLAMLHQFMISFCSVFGYTSCRSDICDLTMWISYIHRLMIDAYALYQSCTLTDRDHARVQHRVFVEEIYDVEVTRFRDFYSLGPPGDFLRTPPGITLPVSQESSVLRSPLENPADLLTLSDILVNPSDADADAESDYGSDAESWYSDAVSDSDVEYEWMSEHGITVRRRHCVSYARYRLEGINDRLLSNPRFRFETDPLVLLSVIDDHVSDDRDSFTWIPDVTDRHLPGVMFLVAQSILQNGGRIPPPLYPVVWSLAEYYCRPASPRWFPPDNDEDPPMSSGLRTRSTSLIGFTHAQVGTLFSDRGRPSVGDVHVLVFLENSGSVSSQIRPVASKRKRSDDILASRKILRCGSRMALPFAKLFSALSSSEMALQTYCSGLPPGGYLVQSC